MDHLISTTTIAFFLGAFAGQPKYIPMALILNTFLFAPMTWWIYKQGRLNATRHSNIFYENSCTPEEVHRIQALDAMENLASEMQARSGYGYFSKDGKFV